MLDTGGSVLTDAGAILLADALSREVPLQFTTIKLGDGELTGTDTPAEFTGLISYWKDIEVTSVSKTDNVLRVRGVYSNDELEAAQWVREVGVFAKTDEIEECLFCYINDGDGEELPSGDSGSIVERVRDVLTTISGATAETILDSSTVYATIYDIEDAVKAADQSITVSDDGISANHNYIFGDNYGGIIEEVTDIEEDKIYLSTNSSQYYRALNTASGSWSGADETDFKCITNFKLSEEIESLDENKLESSDIEKLLRIGYTFGGDLSEQESVSEKTVYNAYDLEEDSANHVYHLCNADKTWTLGDDNPDSDFEEITAESIMEKVESLFEVETETHTYRDVTYEFSRKGNSVMVSVSSSTPDTDYSISNAFTVSQNFKPILKFTDEVSANSTTTWKRGELTVQVSGEVDVNFKAGTYTFGCITYIV
jgi:hypothetical protein